jgi:hypothetical protein
VKGPAVTYEIPDLSTIRNLTEVLQATPNGTAIAELGRRLGLWTRAAQDGGNERRAFTANLGHLDAEPLSDEYGYWTSEFGRITELHSLLTGQKTQLAEKGKRLRASARTRLRQDQRTRPEEKPYSEAALKDMAEDDAGVLTNDRMQVVVETLLSMTAGAKEATQQYLATISREIAYRDAQMKARIY